MDDKDLLRVSGFVQQKHLADVKKHAANVGVIAIKELNGVSCCRIVFGFFNR